MDAKISSEFPFESKFIEINGAKMHYVDVGEGDPILFLHGNPTSSYLWRNVIPHLSRQGRCIAVDLIGMGKSDKPDISYTFADHYQYLEKFIEKMGLKNIALVIHDWGSGLGFNYAFLHQDNVKGIAFMEAIYRPMSWDGIPAEYKIPFKLMRAPFIGWFMVSVMNIFLKKMVPEFTMRKYTKEELDIMKSPYPTIKSRKPIRVWPQMIPFDGDPKETYEPIAAYAQWLQETDIPKLLLYATPGGIIKAKDLRWIKGHYSNIEYVDLGEGMHYVQEDHPHEIGEAISAWYAKIR